jgi:hypothetical protein
VSSHAPGEFSMTSRSIAKPLSKLCGAVALLGLLTAATCEGGGFVDVESLAPGQCILANPILFPPHPPAGQDGDVLQLADKGNVNDFIQCRIIAVTDVDTTVNVVVHVSPSDAQGHGFVGNGRPAIIVNLSR